MPRRPIIHLYQAISGRRMLTRLDELNRTQWLKRDELLALQRKKLHRLLTYAYRWVPYYRQLFDQHGFSPDEVLADLSGFQRLPVLTKSVISDNFDALQTTEGKRRARLSQLNTGGSTGRPLVFMQDSDFRDYVTADIHRHLGWAGWKLGDAHCYIWGAHFEAAASEALRARLMNFALNRFVTNAFVLSDESMGAFATQIRRRRPHIIFGYPASMCRFAQFVREHHMDDIKFEAIFSSAEMIYPEQRRFLEEVFNGRVFNRYGTRELGGISCECSAHLGMHASIDNIYLEILKDGRPAGPGEMGDIIVTNLNNCGMPFVRYAIEDLGAWSSHDSCPCGRQLPMMELMQARHSDSFRTKDGRLVWGSIGGAFGIKGIKQFQVVQKSIDLVVARIVKDDKLDMAELTNIERSVQSSLGKDVKVRFEFPDEIPVLESGKHRASICEIRDPVADDSRDGVTA